MEEKNTNATKRRNPVTWVPSVYFAMGLPFVVLNMVTVLMFKGLDISDAQSYNLLFSSLPAPVPRFWKCIVPRNSLSY